MPTMVREAWTDERLDDLTKHMDEGFREMKSESKSVRSEVAAVREGLNEVREQVAKIDAKIDELVRTMQIGFWLVGSFLVGLMGMFAAQL